MNETLASLALAALSVITLYQLVSKRNYARDWPQAPTKPFVGSLLWVSKHGGMQGAINFMIKRGIPAFVVRSGMMQPALVVADARSASDIMLNDAKLGNKPRLLFYAKEIGMDREFLPTQDSTISAMAKRKAVLNGVQRTLAYNGSTKDSGIERAASRLIQDCHKSLGKAFDCTGLVGLFLPCIALMGLSLSYGMRLTAENRETTVELVHQLTETLMLAGGMRELTVAFPFLVYLLPWRTRRLRASCTKIRKTADALRLTLYREALAVVDQNGLDALEPSTLRTILSDPNRSGLSDWEIQSSIELALGGATDTSSHTLAVIIACLAAWPDWQERIRADLQASNTDAETSLEGLRERASTLLAFIREVFRFYPIFNATSRIATQDFVVDDKRISAGQLVLLVNGSINRDEAVFGANANTFDPSRYYTLIYGRYGHRTFGKGRRSCPGSELAEQFLLLVTARLLSQFQITFATEGPMGEAALKSFVRGTLTMQIRLSHE